MSVAPLPSSGRKPAVPARRRWAWTMGLAVGVALLCGVAVLHSPWMSLHEIEIVGARRSDVAGRLAEAEVGEGAIMIWLRPKEVEEAVLKDPWVGEVRVERVFPDRLVVEVLERTGVAWIGAGRSWRLVAGDGTVLEVAERPGEGLLAVIAEFPDAEVGGRPDQAAWAQVVDLAAALSPPLAARAQVTREAGEWWIRADGHAARLGPAVDLADKGRAFEALLAAGLPEGATIDLVAPTRPAVISGEAPADAGDTGSGEGE